MNLEPVTWSKVSQKEKTNVIYECIYIYGIQRNGTDELINICRAAIETQTQRTDLWTQRGKERVGQIETVALQDIHYHMLSRQKWESAQCCDNLEGWDEMGGGREVQVGGDICKFMADSW